MKMGENKLNNRGASLVLVILCMLFIGIIAAAVLTLTTGNLDTVSKTKGSSKNFYSTESFVDDVKVYLQSIANGAATKAYAATLQEVAVNGDIDLDAVFSEKFKSELKTKINDLQAGTGTVGISTMTFGAFKDDGTPADGSSYTGSVSITPFSSMVYDETTGTLKNINVKYTDASGYETAIDTSFVFNASLPKLEWQGAEKDFNYAIDKYVIISNKDIVPTATTSGNIDGSLYAKNDIIFKLDNAGGTPKTLNVFSESIICGNDLLTSNGKLVLGNVTDGRYRNTDTSAENGSVWCGNLEVRSGEMNTKDAILHVKDDLSLEGESPKYVADGGSYIGFSSDGTASGNVSKHKDSSAIILNGTSPKLDLSAITSLELYGTAYTQVPEVAGTTVEEDYSYYVQGESITYRSLQSAYLIPGECILHLEDDGTGTNKVKVGGHNPMTEAEFEKWETDLNLSERLKDTTGVSLSSDKYKAVRVKYMSTSPVTYVYLYWDFASAGEAVKFFNTKYLVDAKKDYVSERLSMITREYSSGFSSKSAAEKEKDRGYIKLPSSGIQSKGNLVTFDGSLSTPFTSVNGGTIATPGNSTQYDNYFRSLLVSLSKGTAAGNDLFSSMFRMGQSAIGLDLAGTARELDLVGPQGKLNDSGTAYLGWEEPLEDGYKYSGYVMDADGNQDATVWKYKLITGSDIEITSVDANTKYVVVATGKVKISTSGEFNGIIIAKGGVELGSQVDLNCFANFKRTKKGKGTFAGEPDVTEDMGELSALLQVIVNEDQLTLEDGTTQNGNTILRRIFDIASTAANMGEKGGAGDLVGISTDNWKKN